MSASPSRDDMKRAIWAGASFVAVGALILVLGGLPSGMKIIAWVMIGFGALGIVAGALRLQGKWAPELRPPSPRKVAKQRALDEAWLAKMNAPLHHKGDLPELDSGRQSKVRKVIKLLGEEGVFAPDVPDPAKAFEGIADMDSEVTQTSVIVALAEANYWHPEFDPAACLQNVVMHDSKAEQDEINLRSQIDDLIRLAGGQLVVSDLVIDPNFEAWPPPLPPCTISFVVNGAPHSVTYLPDPKYLSSHIHVALAKALRATGAGKRFAWLWNDQGALISCLPDGAIERLNSGPGFDRDGYSGWEWIDEAEPFAAGDPIVTPE